VQTNGAVEWRDRPLPKRNYGKRLLCRSIDICIPGHKPTIISVSFGMPEAGAGKRNYIFPRAGEEIYAEAGEDYLQNVIGHTESGRTLWVCS
jgi:hypothetical protein